jgi:hypothetical protein
MGTMLTHSWQKINAGWHSCHSWQECHEGMITAMTFLLILLTVAVLLSADTVRRVITDGRGPQRPPVSHFQDPDFLAPNAR